MKALPLLFCFALLTLLAGCAKSGWSFSKTITVADYQLNEEDDRILLTIRGKKFGKQGSILLNGRNLDPGHILSWYDHEIQIFVRKPFNYATMQLQKNRALSELIPVWNPTFLPQVQAGTDTYPVLERFRYLSNTVIEVQGQNFGSRYTNQLFLLSREPENYKNRYFSPSMLENYRPLQPEEILLWNDKTVRFIVAQESTEGPIYLLRRDKSELQISNNLYIPASRDFPQPTEKPQKLRLTLRFPEKIVPGISAELSESLPPDKELEFTKQIQIQWPRNTRNQRWTSTKNLSLPVKTLELQPIPEKLAQRFQLPNESWLARASGVSQPQEHLDFFYSPSGQLNTPKNSGRSDYTTRELELYAALLWRNLSLCKRYRVPTWSYQIRQNISPYAKAQEIYSRLLQRFEIQPEQGQLQNWPNLEAEKVSLLSEQILLLFLHSLTRLQIPARIISGAEKNPDLRPYFWLEIYFPDLGWFEVDPLAEFATGNSQAELKYWGRLEPAKIAFFALRDRWQNYDASIRKYGIHWELEVLDG